METLDFDSNGGVSRQKSFGKEGAGFFSKKCVGGKNKSCTLYKKINSACQEKKNSVF
jgi:hypothetical protein